jgi:hypothetical protein
MSQQLLGVSLGAKGPGRLSANQATDHTRLSFGAKNFGGTKSVAKSFTTSQMRQEEARLWAYQHGKKIDPATGAIDFFNFVEDEVPVMKFTQGGDDVEGAYTDSHGKTFYVPKEGKRMIDADLIKTPLRLRIERSKQVDKIVKMLVAIADDSLVKYLFGTDAFDNFFNGNLDAELAKPSSISVMAESDKRFAPSVRSLSFFVDKNLDMIDTSFLDELSGMLGDIDQPLTRPDIEDDKNRALLVDGLESQGVNPRSGVPSLTRSV